MTLQYKYTVTITHQVTAGSDMEAIDKAKVARSIDAIYELKRRRQYDDSKKSKLLKVLDFISRNQLLCILINSTIGILLILSDLYLRHHPYPDSEQWGIAWFSGSITMMIFSIDYWYHE